MAQKITTLVLLIEILFLLNYVSQISTTAAENDGGVIHVTGKVMCQDCTLNYDKWINGSDPIKGMCYSDCVNRYIFLTNSPYFTASKNCLCTKKENIIVSYRYF